MKHRAALCGLIGLTWPAAMALAQDAPPAAGSTQSPAGGYVTREEYDKLQAKLDAVIKEMGEMKKQQTTAQAETDSALDDLEKSVHQNAREVDKLHWGYNKFVLAGDGAVTYVNQQHADSTFEAGFAPLFLYELDKNILFEGALDISGSTDSSNNSSTTTDLTLANITFTLTDNLYVGGGLFAVPFGNYHPHFDPSWINPLPDDPLAFGDRALGPSSETGLFLGGATAVSADAKIEYNAYLTNGPNLYVDSADSAGSLNFDDYTDLNNGKAVGGRLGFLPIPWVDVGYSIQYSNPTPHGFNDSVYALLQCVDAQYKQDLEAIRGTLRLQGEWIWSNVSNATYDSTGADGFGPLNFNNNRNGGYALVSYRPSLVGNKVLKNFEFIARYDGVQVSKNAPGGGNENRWTFGVDYWISPSIVLKMAYEFDDRQVGDNQNAFYLQCGFGL